MYEDVDSESNAHVVTSYDVVDNTTSLAIFTVRCIQRKAIIWQQASDSAKP